MSFHLPPLRERVQDIEPLARGMAVRFARKFSKDLFDIHPDGVGRPGSVPLAGQHPPAGKRGAAGRADQQRPGIAAAASARRRCKTLRRRPSTIVDADPNRDSLHQQRKSPSAA